MANMLNGCCAHENKIEGRFLVAANNFGKDEIATLQT